MLSVTFAAKVLIARDLGLEEPHRLTVGVEDASITLRPSARQANDLTVLHLGKPLLLVASDLARQLEEKQLDVTHGPEGLELRLQDHASQRPPSIH